MRPRKFLAIAMKYYIFIAFFQNSVYRLVTPISSRGKNSDLSPRPRVVVSIIYVCIFECFWLFKKPKITLEVTC